MFVNEKKKHLFRRYFEYLCVSVGFRPIRRRIPTEWAGGSNAVTVVSTRQKRFHGYERRRVILLYFIRSGLLRRYTVSRARVCVLTCGTATRDRGGARVSTDGPKRKANYPRLTKPFPLRVLFVSLAVPRDSLACPSRNVFNDRSAGTSVPKNASRRLARALYRRPMMSRSLIDFS